MTKAASWANDGIYYPHLEKERPRKVSLIFAAFKHTASIAQSVRAQTVSVISRRDFGEGMATQAHHIAQHHLRLS